MDHLVAGRAPVSVRTVLIDGVPVVEIAGEIDSSTDQVVRAGVFTALDRASSALVVDLTGVTFFASAGITMLLDAHRTATARGTGFAVVAEGHAVVRPLQVTELTAVVNLHPTLRQALTALHVAAPSNDVL